MTKEAEIMIRRACLVVAFVATTLSTSSVHAYKLIGPKWPDTAWRTSSTPPGLPWELDADGSRDVVGQADRDDVIAAFTAWQNVVCADGTGVKPHFAPPASLPAAQQTTGIDNKNKVYWIESGWPTEYGKNTLGVTIPAYDHRNNIVDADIVFNGVHFTWSTRQSCQPSQYCTDTYSIALHEQGHFLGLDHSTSRSAVMFASYAGTPTRTLSADDKAGICALYSTGRPAEVPDPVQPGANQCQPCGGGIACKEGLHCVRGDDGQNVCRAGCSSVTACGVNRCLAHEGLPGFKGMCECPGDLEGEDEPCDGNDDVCQDGLRCVQDGSDSAKCRRECAGPASCSPGQDCRVVEGTRVCVEQQTDGGGSDVQQPGGCDCASGSPAGLLAGGAALWALLRRRRPVSST